MVCQGICRNQSVIKKLLREESKASAPQVPRRLRPRSIPEFMAASRTLQFQAAALSQPQAAVVVQPQAVAVAQPQAPAAVAVAQPQAPAAVAMAQPQAPAAAVFNGWRRATPCNLYDCRQPNGGRKVVDDLMLELIRYRIFTGADVDDQTKVVFNWALIGPQQQRERRYAAKHALKLFLKKGISTKVQEKMIAFASQEPPQGHMSSAWEVKVLEWARSEFKSSLMKRLNSARPGAKRQFKLRLSAVEGVLKSYTGSAKIDSFSTGPVSKKVSTAT